MQLKSFLFILFILTCSSGAFAQQQDSSKNKQTLKPYTKEIKGNFLTSYYNQDGNNAAVTGGTGTELLTDQANVFIASIPLDSTKAITIYGGGDYYSSASTDNIDRYVSSASSSDFRGFATIGFNKLNLKRNETYSVKGGLSVEYDYTSVSGGLSYTKEWNEANSEISFVGQAFFDNWTLIYPIELRGRVSLPGSGRQSFNGQVLFSQVINKRLQLGLTGEAIFMQGLLSTPFHRVYFSDATSPDIERLPNQRLKLPVSVRLNYFPYDKLIVRSYYRFYWDDFGIQGNTMELELPIKVTNKITFSPFYRYHTQTASTYFAAYKTHVSTEQFYSSDYDLSGLSSHKVGFGLKYYPYYGLFRSKPFLKSKRVFIAKYIEFRGSMYSRSTGLTATIGSLNLAFSVK